MDWIEEYWLRLIFVTAYLSMLVYHSLLARSSRSHEGGDGKDDPSGERFACRSNCLNHVRFEQIVAAKQSAHHRQANDGCGNGRANGEPDLETEVRVRRSEDDAENDPDNDSPCCQFFGRDVRHEGE